MYLFWVRHFNDIDHIAPVVWKAFVADIVNGGDTDSDVLGRYEGFRVNCAIAKQVPGSQSAARTAN